MRQSATPPESGKTTHFDSISRRVLQGRIRLFSTFTDAQREAARLDCVAVLVGDEFPGCVGLIECRKGRATLAMSYSQIAWAELPWPPFEQMPIEAVIAMCQDFVAELETLAVHGSSMLDELDTDTALRLLRLLHTDHQEVAQIAH